MSEEEPVGDQIVTISEAFLKRRKSLLIVLQCIHILAGATV